MKTRFETKICFHYTKLTGSHIRTPAKHIIFEEVRHEIISVAILSLRLIQVAELSVTGGAPRRLFLFLTTRWLSTLNVPFSPCVISSAFGRISNIKQLHILLWIKTQKIKEWCLVHSNFWLFVWMIRWKSICLPATTLGVNGSWWLKHFINLCTAGEEGAFHDWQHNGSGTHTQGLLGQVCFSRNGGLV